MMPSAQPRSSSWTTSKPVSFQPQAPKPQFIKPLQNTTVQEKQRATLQCVVKGSPDTQVKWYKNGNPIEPSPDYLINYDRITGACSLTIVEAFDQDGGQYTCVATNPTGSDSSIAWLVVKPTPQAPAQYAPQHAQQRPQQYAQQPPFRQQPVPQHQPLKLGTIESSRVEPAPLSPTKSKPVEIVRAYPKFEAPQQAQQQQPQQPIDASAMVKPKVLQELRDVNLVEGGQALFECRIQGNPLDIKWYKGDTELKNQFRYKISHDEKTGLARLFITTVLEDDVGSYTCRAVNQLGEASTSSRLVPYGK